MIFDLSQPSTGKNEKMGIFWGLKKEKLHLCSWKYFLRNTDRCLKLSRQNMLLEVFDSQTVAVNSLKPALPKMKELEYLRPKENKNFTDAVENSFLCMVNAFLKLALQNIFCTMCRS